MPSQKLLDEIAAKINEVVSQGPVKDMEKNLRALLQNMFARMDLVTREEFEVQQEVLLRTREKLAQMEARIAELEKLRQPEPKAGA